MEEKNFIWLIKIYTLLSKKNVLFHNAVTEGCSLRELARMMGCDNTNSNVLAFLKDLVKDNVLVNNGFRIDRPVPTFLIDRKRLVERIKYNPNFNDLLDLMNDLYIVLGDRKYR